MPRKKLEFTHEFPYHIVARSNNKEWFYLPIDQSWEIFVDLLLKVNIRFSFQIHSFILMNNHYHLIGTTSENYHLWKVMEWFQRSANRTINDRAGRINHLFGGPYKASLIRNEDYYFHATKYLYRNPVEAKTVDRVEDYKYSSLRECRIPLVTPVTGIADLLPRDPTEFLNVLNESYPEEAYRAISNGLKKTEFKMPTRIRKPIAKQLHRTQSQ
ncbi:hypothetical protein GW916_02425 [bacterium]|nr:hypothetical protein [bacterium]